MLASTTDLQSVLEQLAWLAVPRLGDWCQIHLQHPDSTIHHHTIAHSDPADAELQARLAKRHRIDLTGAHPAAEADRAGQALLLDQLTRASLHRIARDADHLELLTALDIGSGMVVPLVGRTRILGTITLASHQPGRYTQADLTLAENLARRTASAIEHADRAHHPNPPAPSHELHHRNPGDPAPQAPLAQNRGRCARSGHAHRGVGWPWTSSRIRQVCGGRPGLPVAGRDVTRSPTGPYRRPHSLEP